MSGYGAFAKHYDALTGDVDYRARAVYFDGLLRDYAQIPVRILLDLACGTGSLSWKLAALGYDVIGVDASGEMLALAAAKDSAGKLPLFLRQPMQRLDLYGTVEGCVCALDSLNHLPGPAALERTFSGVSLFLQPGGVFLFDLNTAYKHRQVLADHVFVIEQEGLYLVWRNELQPDDSVRITLDFFEPGARGYYRRSTEQFAEHVFSDEQIRAVLRQSGLEYLDCFLADTREAPGERAERVVYVARKPLEPIINRKE